MASEANEEVEAAIQAAEEGVGDVAGVGNVLEVPEDQGGPGGPYCQIEPGSPQGQDCPSSASSHGTPGSLDGQGGAGACGSEGGPGVADNQADPGAHDHPGGHGVPVDQGGSGSHDDQGGAGARDHPRGPDGQYEQAGHRVLGGREAEERVGPAAVGAANVARAPRASGPGGDAAPEAIGRGDRPIVFTITVPFGSRLEAEMARQAMDIEDPLHQQAIQKEFRVHDSILAVWTAEDPGPLPDSVNSFFQRLFLVIRNIQHSRPRFPLRPGRGAGP